MREAAQGPGRMLLRPRAALVKRWLAQKPEMRATIEALIANRFEPDASAFALGIHRNTLGYRLGRLKQLTGLEPLRCPDDAILLRVLMQSVPD